MSDRSDAWIRIRCRALVRISNKGWEYGVLIRETMRIGFGN